MKYIKLILSLTICFTALSGDYLVFKSRFSDSFPFRAITDNSVHAIIGFFSSLLFFSYDITVSSQLRLYNVLLCTAVSSLIDIDHLFVARSFNIKDFTNMKQRGILHCTTFWMLVTGVLFTYSYITRKLKTYISTWMLVLAFTSHHIRDGNRRGLWMYPFGSTPPIPKYLYVFLIATLPILFAHICIYFKPPEKYTVVQNV